MTTAPTFDRTVRRPGRLRLITIDDPSSDLDGLQMLTRSVSLDVMTRVTGAVQFAGRKNYSTTDMAEILDLFGAFAESIQQWNMTEDDDETPVPCTVDGLRSLEIEYVMQILMAWMQGLLDGGDKDLKDDSNSGAPVPEVEIPMVAL